MKKVLLFLFVFILGITLVGCKIDFGTVEKLDPKQNGEEVPKSVEVVSVNKSHKLYVEETLQLKATVYPETVTEKVVFLSNNEGIATVDDKGLVTGVSQGTVKITAKVSKTISFNNITTVEGYIVLTVLDKQIQITSVEITGPSEMYVNDILKLNVVKQPSNATYNGTWSVNNENAIIDQNGRLTAKNTGTVVVTYFVSDLIKATKTINIINRQGTPTKVEIVVREIIEVGEKLSAFINVTPQGANVNATWTSSNSSIASIDQSGNITAHSAGNVTITATVLTLMSSVEIIVIDNTINTSTLEDNIVDLVRTKKGAVLGVSNYKLDDDGDLMLDSLGSGFIYKVEFILKDGSILKDIADLRTFNDVDYYKYYLITNRHVVEGSDSLKIYMHETGLEVNASLIQYDDKVDVAIVTFAYHKYIKPLTLADSDELVAGRFAIAIGNPSGYEFSSTATFGLISHPKRYLATDTNDDGVNDWDSEYIQHDVAINPGNSGGPLFNLKGEVIGINTLKYVANNIEGMGFSIPINVVKNLIPYLEDGEKPIRPLIGITAIAIKDIRQNPKTEYDVPEEIENGLYVISVVPGSVAERGGIIENDIITKFNNAILTSTSLLRAELNQIVVGSNTEIEIVVYRNGNYITLTLVF